GDLLRQRRGDEPGERQPAAARTARVHQQRALVLLRGVRDARQRQRDRAAGGVGVVQRHLDGRALERRVVVGGALLPGRGGGAERLRGVRGAGLGGHGREARGDD